MSYYFIKMYDENSYPSYEYEIILYTPCINNKKPKKKKNFDSKRKKIVFNIFQHI